MTKAAVIYEKGGPEVFKWEEIKVPSPVSYTHLTLPTNREV